MNHLGQEFKKTVMVRGVKLESYPRRLSKIGYKGIPKEIRITVGKEEGAEEVYQVAKEIVKAFQNPFGYTAIDHIKKVLKHRKLEDIYSNIIWLVKNGRGTLNIDRMGNAVYFKPKVEPAKVLGKHLE